MVHMAPYEWTVVGAGPAGTAAVGKLLDHGIEPARIAWIDPAFAGGDVGGKWRTVSSNTVVGTFLSHGGAKGTVTSHFKSGSGAKASWTASG